MVIVDFLVSHAIVIVVAALVLLVVFKSIRIANQYERGVVFRLGKYNRTAGPGIYIVWFPVKSAIEASRSTASAKGTPSVSIRKEMMSPCLPEEKS